MEIVIVWLALSVYGFVMALMERHDAAADLYSLGSYDLNTVAMKMAATEHHLLIMNITSLIFGFMVLAGIGALFTEPMEIRRYVVTSCLLGVVILQVLVVRVKRSYRHKITGV